MDWAAVRKDLTAHGQDHLLRHLEELSREERQCLYDDITELNLPRLSTIWDQTQATLTNPCQIKDDKLQPLDSSIVGSTFRDKDRLDAWRDIGEPPTTHPPLLPTHLPHHRPPLPTHCPHHPHYYSSPLQVLIEWVIIKWPCYYWLGVKVHDSMSRTLRACTMLDYPRARASISYKLRGSLNCRQWLDRGLANTASSRGEIIIK